MSTNTEILTPPARLVEGSLYKENTTDADGNPLTIKSGPNLGQPRVEFYFAVAIPKGSEQSWAQTPWGASIYGTGQTAFLQACQSPQFAWKVRDGDSTIPNSKGKRPCDRTGFPGHWVLSFSSGYPPKTVRDNGNTPMLDKDAINLGDWVQVFGSVGGNGSQQRPGVFLNHSAVNFIGFGERIATGVDLTTVGFGGHAMPAGASLTPPAGSYNPAAGAAALPRMLPGMPSPAAAAPALPGMPAPLVVQPHPGILTPPAPGVPVAPPPAPVARQMTAKAGGAPYESFIAQNWTDAMLVQHGYMVA